MKIAIIGMPKTGTTALYESVKAELPKSTVTSFEPKTVEELEFVQSSKHSNALTKIMFGRVKDVKFNPDNFDKTIVIVRDPRDYLVSSLLYKFDNPNVSKNSEKFNALIELFSKKQQKPSSVSFTELFQAFGQGDEMSWHTHLNLYFDLIEFIKSDNLFVLKYEDFADDSLEQLNEYLGLSVKNSRDLSGWTAKIKRKGVSGDWKNWFTEDDLYLKDVFSGVMNTLDYTDWTINDEPIIEKEHSIDYIIKLAASNKSDPTKSQDITEEYIENLYSAASDSKVIPITRLGLLKLEGKHVERDVLGAFALFVKGAELGSVRSLRELGKLISNSCSDNMRAMKLGADHYFQLAVDNDDPESCYFLGEMYFVGDKIEKDNKKAFDMYLKGAQLGSKSCMRKLAVCYDKGMGTTVDKVQSHFWLEERNK